MVAAPESVATFAVDATVTGGRDGVFNSSCTIADWICAADHRFLLVCKASLIA